MDKQMEENIKSIKERYQAAEITMLPEFINKYKNDSRGGVVTLVEKASKKLRDLEKEKERTLIMKKYEDAQPETFLICGIDEVGRGLLAGRPQQPHAATHLRNRLGHRTATQRPFINAGRS